MSFTLLQEWYAKVSSAKKVAIIKSHIESLLGSDSEEIEHSVSELRLTSRDDAITLQAIVRAIAGRNNLYDHGGTYRQVHLLTLPLILQVDGKAANGNVAQVSNARPNTQEILAVPKELKLEELLCDALQLGSGSLRAAPFFMALSPGRVDV